jgi:plastocyanin
MRAPKLMTAGLILATAGLVFAGCGSSGKKTSSSATTAASTATTTQAAPQQSGSLTVQTEDFKFVPNTLSAKVGQQVTVNLKNAGQAEHNFSITALGVNKDLKPGETATVTFTPKSEGNVEFFCEYHKASKNMVGTLTVGM